MLQLIKKWNFPAKPVTALSSIARYIAHVKWLDSGFTGITNITGIMGRLSWEWERTNESTESPARDSRLLWHVQNASSSVFSRQLLPACLLCWDSHQLLEKMDKTDKWARRVLGQDLIEQEWGGRELSKNLSETQIWRSVRQFWEQVESHSFLQSGTRGFGISISLNCLHYWISKTSRNIGKLLQLIFDFCFVDCFLVSTAICFNGNSVQLCCCLEHHI